MAYEPCATCDTPTFSLPLGAGPTETVKWNPALGLLHCIRSLPVVTTHRPTDLQAGPPPQLFLLQ